MDMRISLYRRSLFCALLLYGLATGSVLPSQAEELIQLSEFLAAEKEVILGGGYFVELCNGQLLFFKKAQMEAFERLCDGETFSAGGKFLLYDPQSKKQSVKNLSVALTSSKVLTFDSVAATASTMERLHLSPSWRKVLKQSWLKDPMITHLSDGDFLIAGGSRERGPVQASAQLYHTDSDSFDELPSMCQRRVGGASLLMRDGRVLLAGGTLGKAPAAEIFDPQLKKFVPVAAKMVADRGETTLCNCPDGSVLIFGGHNFCQVQPRLPNCPVEFSIERFDPKKNDFEFVGQMKYARHFRLSSAACLPNGNFLICGGEYSYPLVSEILQVSADGTSSQEIGNHPTTSQRAAETVKEGDQGDMSDDELLRMARSQLSERWQRTISEKNLDVGSSQAAVECVILSSGEVFNARVVTSCNKAFDDACLSTVRAIKLPARKRRGLNCFWIRPVFSREVRINSSGFYMDDSVPPSLVKSESDIEGDRLVKAKYDELSKLKRKVLGQDLSAVSSLIGGTKPFISPDNHATYTFVIDGAIDSLGTTRKVCARVHFHKNRADKFTVLSE